MEGDSNGGDLDELPWKSDGSSLSERLQNVRRNLKKAEDQLNRWRTECSDELKNLTIGVRAKPRSKSADGASQRRNRGGSRSMGLLGGIDHDDDDEIDNIDSFNVYNFKATNDLSTPPIDGLLLYSDHYWTDDPKNSPTLVEEKYRDAHYWRSLARKLSHELHRERFEMQRKVKILQDDISNLKLLRRHSKLDENLRETENFALQNERDSLTIALYKLRIQQMSNKLELEKSRDDLYDVVQHIRMIEMDFSKKRMLLRLSMNIIKQLNKIRDEMNLSTPNVKKTTSASTVIDSEARKKNATSLLVSLREISTKKLLDHLENPEPKVAGLFGNSGYRLIRSKDHGPNESKSRRSTDAEHRRKLTVSWGGCIVLDKDGEVQSSTTAEGPSGWETTSCRGAL